MPKSEALQATSRPNRRPACGDGTVRAADAGLTSMRCAEPHHDTWIAM